MLARKAEPAAGRHGEDDGASIRRPLPSPGGLVGVWNGEDWAKGRAPGDGNGEATAQRRGGGTGDLVRQAGAGAGANDEASDQATAPDSDAAIYAACREEVEAFRRQASVLRPERSGPTADGGQRRRARQASQEARAELDDWLARAPRREP